MNTSLVEDIWNFAHFNGSSSLALVHVEDRPRGSGNWYAFFDSKGVLGWLSDWFNDSEAPVRIWCNISKKLVAGNTCGKHMLVGQRQWQVERIEDSRLLIKTEPGAFIPSIECFEQGQPNKWKLFIILLQENRHSEKEEAIAEATRDLDRAYASHGPGKVGIEIVQSLESAGYIQVKPAQTGGNS